MVGVSWSCSSCRLWFWLWVATLLTLAAAWAAQVPNSLSKLIHALVPKITVSSLSAAVASIYKSYQCYRLRHPRLNYIKVEQHGQSPQRFRGHAGTYFALSVAPPDSADRRVGTAPWALSPWSPKRSRAAMSGALQSLRYSRSGGLEVLDQLKALCHATDI